MEESTPAKRQYIEVGDRRAPFTASHRLANSLDKFHLLIGVTGSVAIYELIEEFRKKDVAKQMVIKVRKIF
jgi:hypothetical protein